MNELVVVAFDDELKADEALVAVRRRQMRGEVDIRDTAIVLKTRRGRLEVRQTTEISTSHRKQPDGWWGLLIAVMLGGPMGRDRYGAGFSRLYGRLSELGIDDDFVTQVSELIEPGQSALFVLIDRENGDSATAILRSLGGQVFSTPLPEGSVRRIVETMRSSAAP